MIKTKNLTTDYEQIPDTWIFEYYLKLGVALCGQDLKMRSPFNPNDKDPSFFIYYSNASRKYKFKDFSADKQGDGVELVQVMYKLERRYDAVLKITNDYNEFVSTNGNYASKEFVPDERYKLTQFELRNWNKFDANYWLKYKIDSSLLEKYNVQPLKSYTLEKNNGEDIIRIESLSTYGYFRKDGTLYKIYQPLNTKKKFLKVQDYIQGVDQLKFDKPYLVMCSSLKDGLAFTKLGFKNAEFIAPDSENSILPERIILKLKERYKGICTLFDNDTAGLTSMQKYKERYNINGAHLKVEKDIADCVKQHGIVNTREFIYPVLTEALTGIKKEL